MLKVTTRSQDKDFIAKFFENLDASIDASFVLEWVAGNFSPEEVFDPQVLRIWALDNGFVEEI